MTHGAGHAGQIASSIVANRCAAQSVIVRSSGRSHRTAARGYFAVAGGRLPSMVKRSAKSMPTYTSAASASRRTPTWHAGEREDGPRLLVEARAIDPAVLLLGLREVDLDGEQLPRLDSRANGTAPEAARNQARRRRAGPARAPLFDDYERVRANRPERRCGGECVVCRAAGARRVAAPGTMTRDERHHHGRAAQTGRRLASRSERPACAAGASGRECQNSYAAHATNNPRTRRWTRSHHDRHEKLTDSARAGTKRPRARPRHSIPQADKRRGSVGDVGAHDQQQ